MEELLRDLERRSSSAIAMMGRRGVDYLALTPSPNFRYLAGFSEDTHERVMLLILTSGGEKVLIAPRLANIPGWVSSSIDVVLWGDEDSVSGVIDRIAKRLRIHGRRAAFEDSMSFRVYTMLRDILAPSSVSLASEILGDLRMRKSLYEIRVIMRAVRAAERVFEEIYKILTPGLSERFIASQVSSIVASEGFDEAFRSIVAFGENTANPHHIPGDRKLSRGDLVLVDLGVVVDGYISDLTRMFSLGPLSRDARDRFSCLMSCFSEALSMISPGIRASEIDLRVRSCLSEYGFGENILHRTGHGIGIEVHEPPYISINSDHVLDRGNVFTIEPGIYFRGLYGLRVESNIAILDNGDVIVLDKISRDVIQI
jgi:Xaa-Pro dipeptidase